VTRKDPLLKRFYSRLFFNISRKITHLKIEPGLGVFRAIRRNAVEQINGIPEKTGTILSLMYWAGMDYSVVKMERDKRHAGSSGYTFTRMLGLAAERIFSYSIFPIRLASYFGLIIGGASLVYGVYLILRHFIFDDLAQGWTSTMVTLSFLFGINFIFLGIIGEYLGRIFLEAKGRPKYMVGKIIRYDNEE
jgi:glycosyltransferase involved in cell wall biosynthesis